MQLLQWNNSDSSKRSSIANHRRNNSVMLWTIYFPPTANGCFGISSQYIIFILKSGWPFPLWSMQESKGLLHNNCYLTVHHVLWSSTEILVAFDHLVHYLQEVPLSDSFLMGSNCIHAKPPCIHCKYQHQCIQHPFLEGGGSYKVTISMCLLSLHKDLRNAQGCSCASQWGWERDAMLWKSMKVENMTYKFKIRGECNLAQRLCSQIPTLLS